MTLHCWEYATDFDDDGTMNGLTCLLPDGHEGPHEFTPDDEITVRFVGDPEEKP